MKKFLFKSSDPDFKKMFSILETLQKNMVYSTYKLDNILKLVKSLTVDTNVQKQVDEFYDLPLEDNAKDIPENEQWLPLKTATRQKRVSIPGKKPFGTIYNLARRGIKYSGYYDKYNLRQYDPQVYVDKYTYKPRKRIAGYLGQKLHGKKKKFRSSRNSYFYKEPDQFCNWNFRNECPSYSR